MDEAQQPKATGRPRLPAKKRKGNGNPAHVVEGKAVISDEWREWVALFLKHGNGHRATRIVWPELNAEQVKHRSKYLREHPRVREELDVQREMLRRTTNYTLQNAFEEAGTVMQESLRAGQFMAAGRMAELRAKLAGHLVERVQVEERLDIRAILEGVRQRTRCRVPGD
jgi:hypothetical protein